MEIFEKLRRKVTPLHLSNKKEGVIRERKEKTGHKSQTLDFLLDCFTEHRISLNIKQNLLTRPVSKIHSISIGEKFRNSS